jgi:hypothetical protein
MPSFTQQRDVIEAEGVYIGGWSLGHVFTPRKLDGKHGKKLTPIISPYLVTDYKCRQ